MSQENGARKKRVDDAEEAWLELRVAHYEELRAEGWLEARLAALEAEAEEAALEASLERERDRQPASGPARASTGSTGLPQVKSGVDVHRVIEELEAALFHPRTGDPRLYCRGHRLVIVRGMTAADARRLRLQRHEPDAMVIAPLSSASLLPRVTEHVDYGRYHKTKVGYEWRPEIPNKDVRAAFLTKADAWPGARPLRGISATPILHRDGSIAADGYDAETGYLVASNVRLPRIAEAPTLDDAKAALQELVEPFEEFHVQTEAERLAPVALVVTKVLRAQFSNAPTYIFTAPQKAAGKSLQAKAALLLATGRIPSGITWPRKSEEQEKILSSAADAGVDVVFFDNAEQGAVIGGAPLDKVSTCDGHTGFRVLGQTQLRQMPWSADVVFTSNRAGIGGDTDRRAVVSELLRRATPVEDYAHPDLLAYIRDERPRLLAAVFTLARAWIRAGSPRAGVRRLDSFETWAWTVASMIKWAGGGDVRELVRDSIGTEADQHELALLIGMHGYLSERGRRDVTTKELLDDVVSKGGREALGQCDWYEPLREAIEAIGGFDRLGDLDKRRFGKRLAKMCNVVHGGYRLKTTGKTKNKPRWTVEGPAKGAGSVDPLGSVRQSPNEQEDREGDPVGRGDGENAAPQTDPNGSNRPQRAAAE